MIRSAMIQMETELTQEEFEKWLLGLIKIVATKPEQSNILKITGREITGHRPSACGGHISGGNDGISVYGQNHGQVKIASNRNTCPRRQQ